MRRRILKATYVAVLLSFVPAASASAGEYHVYSCRTPSGEVAPADGWVGEKVVDWDRAEDTCSQPGGALVAAEGDETVHPTNTDAATWTFSTPADETMTGATLWRAGDADGGSGVTATYVFWLAGPSEVSNFDVCAAEFECPTGLGDPAVPLSPANKVVVPPANLGAHLYAFAGCSGTAENYCPAGHGDANGYAAVVYLYAADIVLEQSAGPTADNVSGELASAPTVSGMSDVIFSASDPGAGVWEATLSIDGKVVQGTVPDENGGRCRNVGQTTDGLAAFLYLQPCPASESVDVPFDTTKVNNGVHHLIVSVLDAAGNSAPVLDREINVENSVPAAAPPSTVVPAKPTPKRRARVTLKVTPRRVGANRRVYFSGRLLGGSIPKGGKLLVVEGRRSRRGAWLKFDVIRSRTPRRDGQATRKYKRPRSLSKRFSTIFPSCRWCFRVSSKTVRYSNPLSPSQKAYVRY